MATAKVYPLIQDCVTADPDRYKVEFEDERIRVIRTRYGPREKSPTHMHPEMVLICLTEAHFRFSNTNGSVEEFHAKAGEIFQHTDVEHDPENLSDQPFEGVLIELKK